MIEKNFGQEGFVDRLQAANVFSNGALLVDDYDNVIFDDLMRAAPIWSFIDKRRAVGDFTNGFYQSALGTARFADKRSPSYSATSPTRAARTPKEIKAIWRNLEFGLYDRSVYAQQGQRFGDLTAKDTSDIVVSIMKLWNDAFYHGDAVGSPLEFSGLKTLLAPGTDVGATTSVVKSIQEHVVTMVNTSVRDVMPTHILANGRVRQIIAQEYFLTGEKFPYIIGQKGEQIGAIDTVVGPLPIIVDPYNSVDVATPNVYPTYIVSADKLSWQYIEPLGYAGADPKVFQIALTNTIVQQFTGCMFGALELLGTSDHHLRLNVADRAVVITPVPTT